MHPSNLSKDFYRICGTHILQSLRYFVKSWKNTYVAAIYHCRSLSTNKGGF